MKESFPQIVEFVSSEIHFHKIFIFAFQTFEINVSSCYRQSEYMCNNALWCLAAYHPELVQSHDLSLDAITKTP